MKDKSTRSNKIAIDVRVFYEKKRSGVEEYTKNLLINLFQIDQKNNYVLFFNSYHKKNPKIIKKLLKFPNVTLKRLYYPNRLLNLSFLCLNYPKIDKITKCDILICTNIIFLGISKKTKLILTVHDMSFEYFKEFLSFWKKIWHILVNPKYLIKRADKVVTVSKSSKKDIISYIKNKKIKKKIKVVYPGIKKNSTFNKKDEKKILIKYNLKSKYILTLGTLEPRKNVSSIIQAFDFLRTIKKIDHSLVIAGEKGWLMKEFRTALTNSKSRDKIQLIGSIKDKEKSIILKNASLFIYPSFYEGFGFPPLESLKMCVPTVLSYTSSLPEMSKENAYYINPYNKYELVKAINAVINEKKSKTNKIIKKMNLLERYDWKRTAKKYLQIINSL